MELSETQELLVDVFRETELTEREIVATAVLVMDSEEATGELLDWVYDNQVKDSGRIFAKLAEVLKKHGLAIDSDNPNPASPSIPGSSTGLS